MVIKQKLCDEDEALNSTQSDYKESKNVKGKTKATEKVVKKESVKTEYLKLETPTESRKKRHNRSCKLRIDKRNNYTYVPNAPRNLRQNCSSSNHIIHICKKPGSTGPKPTCKYKVPLKDKDYPL